MNRRTLLKATAGSAVLGISGCLSSNSSSDEAGQSLNSGVVQNGLKVAVTGYTFIDRYAVYERELPRKEQSFSSVQYKTPPTSGGQFLLVYVFVEHQGSARRHFPSGENDTTLKYDEQAVNQFYPQYVFTNGQRDFASYYGAVSHAEAKSRGAFPPFTAKGYMVFGVPQEFDPEKVSLKITWGWEQEPGSNKGPRNATWELTPDSENNTAGEPPTSATHDGQVTTRTQDYNTSTGDGTTTVGWETVDGTHTYNDDDS